jgi:hypothetical protein
MKIFRIVMGATALAVVVATVIACNKEKTAQQEAQAPQHQMAGSNDLTLAEMIEAISWEDGKAFFENQPIKDYTAVCEKVVKDCGFAEKEVGWPYVILWVYKTPNNICNSDFSGACLAIRRKDSFQANATGCYEDGKFVIIPTTEENGFTADGYLVIGSPIEIQNDSIVIQEGIYAAYYDEELGLYTAVAVDYIRID